MSSSSYRLEPSIKSHLAPILRGEGFSGSGRSFRRLAGELIHVVQVQPSRYGFKFAINLGIHPMRIPDVCGNAPTLDTIREENCEFRRRLSQSGADQWWEHDGTRQSMDAAMLQAAIIYKETGRTLFAEQSGPNCSLLTVTPGQFESGHYRFSGFASTEVRMARALALMRLQAGNTDHARAFAKIGLARLGGAGRLREELEEICAGT
jgi:hypothetical protein